MDLTLISIVVGLGLTELLLTFYRLVQERRQIAWDPLPLAWGFLVLIAVVNYWWGIRPIMAEASGWTSGAFLLAMIAPVFLFLASAAALPRVEPGASMDMKAAYAGGRSAFLWYFLGYQAGNWILDLAGLAGSLPLVVALHRAAICVALVVAVAARSRRWDWAAVVVIGAVYSSRLISQLVS